MRTPLAALRSVAWARAVMVLAGGVLTATMLFVYTFQASLLARLDFKIYDLLLPLRAMPSPSPVPAIIDLDEASLAAYGQWPWPRYLMADLLDRLTQAEVAAIGLDIMFAETDRSSPERVRESLRRDRNITADFSGIPDELLDYDQVLSRALGRSPAIIGAYADYMDAHGESAVPPSVTIIERETPGAIDWKPMLPEARGAVMPVPALRGKAPLGFINAAPDMDGIVREIPLLVKIGKDIHPALALRSLMRGLGQRTLTLLAGPYGLEAVRIRMGSGTLSIPVSPRGSMRIPFIGPRRTYAYYSAADVLGGRIDSQELLGRVVFVGTSVAGLADIRATPFDPACPGVEIHAAAVDAMLAGNTIHLPPWGPLAQLAGIILAGFLSTVIFGFARPRIYLPAAAFLLAAPVFATRHAFTTGLFISPLYAMLTVTACGATLVLIRFWQEERQKRRLRTIFSRYVSPEVVKRITGAQENFLAGEEKTLSIMFSDIRGFTSLSETLAPREVVSLLNRYFSAMTDQVRERCGTLDKFIGDALMAYWNAPLDVPDHARRALETALSMQAALPGLNAMLKPELDIEIHIGIGVHTGTAFVGNMGSKDMISYTCIGDNVNLTSRLEGLCPYYGVDIIISGETMNALDNNDAFVFQPLDILRVKGKLQPVSIYRPLRKAEAEKRRAELSVWEDARGHYTAGNFKEADKLLVALCDEFPEIKLYAVFSERVMRLREKQPSFWNGIWTLNSK